VVPVGSQYHSTRQVRSSRAQGARIESRHTGRGNVYSSCPPSVTFWQTLLAPPSRGPHEWYHSTRRVRSIRVHGARIESRHKARRNISYSRRRVPTFLCPLTPPCTLVPRPSFKFLPHSPPLPSFLCRTPAYPRALSSFLVCCFHTCHVRVWLPVQISLVPSWLPTCANHLHLNTNRDSATASLSS
jgi:hypothetical protein